jgi:DNA-binding MarR family transcriptional regulator
MSKAITSSQNSNNAMLAEDLSESEDLWLRRVLSHLYINYDYCVSWHLREDFGVPTSLINYHLGKLVKKGYLKKEAHRSHTKFHLTERSKVFR